MSNERLMQLQSQTFDRTNFYPQEIYSFDSFKKNGTGVSRHLLGKPVDFGQSLAVARKGFLVKLLNLQPSSTKAKVAIQSIFRHKCPPDSEQISLLFQ